MKIYIVRHGQIPSNALRLHTNTLEDLTALGIEQAEELSKKISNINFDIIYSSPYLRAKHTANILNVHKKRIIVDDRLSERNNGNYSGLPLKADQDRDNYWDYNLNSHYGTSELIKPFFARVYNFLDELKTKNYNTVLIVAHSGISKAFSGYFEGIQDGKFLTRGLANCEVKIYEL